MRMNIIIFLVTAAISLFAFPMTAVAVSTSKPVAAAQSSSASQPASSRSDPGSNLAGWLKSWVGALFGVVVGAVGLGAVAKRSVGEGLALLLVALIVGGFVIAPDSMNTLTQAVWAKIAG
ncbi:MAG TPA: hypothetical protein VIC05_03360 [Solirubrobacteraceae bacterium]